MALLNKEKVSKVNAGFAQGVGKVYCSYSKKYVKYHYKSKFTMDILMHSFFLALLSCYQVV